jgi:hypothetical protein
MHTNEFVNREAKIEYLISMGLEPDTLEAMSDWELDDNCVYKLEETKRNAEDAVIELSKSLPNPDAQATIDEIRGTDISWCTENLEFWFPGHIHELEEGEDASYPDGYGPGGDRIKNSSHWNS